MQDYAVIKTFYNERAAKAALKQAHELFPQYAEVVDIWTDDDGGNLSTPVFELATFCEESQLQTVVDRVAVALANV